MLFPRNILLVTHVAFSSWSKLSYIFKAVFEYYIISLSVVCYISFVHVDGLLCLKDQGPWQMEYLTPKEKIAIFAIATAVFLLLK